MSNQENTLLPNWRVARLDTVCLLNPRRPELRRADDTPTTFVPMDAVDEDGHGIARTERRPYGEIRKGYTFFAEGDVLFAKITPCMQNGKHAIARHLADGIGFGSTEFHVLRPLAEVIPEWIHFYLIQPSILDGAKSQFTGAVGQQRVPEEYLATLEIPIPPLDEQRWIAEGVRKRLLQIGLARDGIQAQLDAARLITKAHLRAVFESDEARGWPARKLGDLLKLRAEVIHPRNKPRGPARFVGLEHIESQTGRRTGVLDVEMSDLTGRKPRFLSGDIVYGYLRPYLNKVWIAEFDGLCSVDQYVFSVNEEEADTRFVAHFMRSPVYLERAPIDQTPGQLPRIRTEEVASVEINLPSLTRQRAIADNLDRALRDSEQLLESLSAQLAAVEHLPSALLAEAFRGAMC